MSEIKLLTYIKRWCLPIALLSMVMGYLFSQYIEGQQTYTASAIIQYTNDIASSGMTPTGSSIDVNEICASNVISSAIRELGLNVSIDFIRSRIYIEGIIPEDEKTKTEALLDRGESYSYFPTSYYVSFSVSSDYSEEFARRVLEAVFRSYISFYGGKYVDVSITPNNIENTSNESFDYIERMELIQSGLNDIIGFVNIRAEGYPLFYCSTTGYSFGNLLDLYEELRELRVYKLFSRILDERLTKDADALVKKYQYRLDDAKIQKAACEERLVGVKALIDGYSSKSLEAKATTAGDITGGDYEGSSIIVAPFQHDYTSNKVITYDMLIDSFVDNSVALELSNKDIEFYEERLRIFSPAQSLDPHYDAEAVEIETEINEIIARANELYSMLLTTVREFNEYNSARNIALKSTIYVSSGINTKLYTLIAFVFFIIIGVIGVIVIARLGQIYRYHRFIDPKTDIPNRLSCDNEIEKLSQKPLSEDVSCVSISLTSLINTNSRDGRRQGDIMLKNFGLMLKYCGSKYGFVGYNGGPNFICIFEQCKLEKAASFKQMLMTAIENYNHKYPESSISIRISICESGQESIYSIRELLKRSMSLLYADK